MDIIEMHKYFNQLIDKLGSPYFKEEEIDRFINRAQLSILDDYIYNRHNKRSKDEEPPYGFENTSLISEAVSPFISEITSISTDANGQFLIAAVNVALGGIVMYHLSNLSRKSSTDNLYYSCQFVRHNDYFRLIKNVFKVPSETHPIHRKFDAYIQVNPVGVANLEMTAIKHPLDVNNDIVQPLNNVSSQFPEKVHNEIVIRAVQQAGYSTREFDFYQVATAEKQKE